MEEIKMNNEYNLPVGLIVVCGIGVIIGAGIMSCSKAYIPRTNSVQTGYIAPSRLEIKCKDLDGNDQPETIMKIDDKAYLLREVDGKPVLSAYEIKPAEVVPK